MTIRRAILKYTFPNHNISLFAENIFLGQQQASSIIPGVPGTKTSLPRQTASTTTPGRPVNEPRRYGYRIGSNTEVTEHRVNKRSFLIAGIGFSYDQNPSVQFYGNISQNYRAINFNDMSIVNPNFRVYPNLKDEKGYSADLGVRGHVTDILSYDVSLFTIDYANRIGSVLLKDTSSITYQYTTNISKSRNLGVESFCGDAFRSLEVSGVWAPRPEPSWLCS